MAETGTSDLFERVTLKRKELGVSERELSIRVTGNPDFIRDLKRHRHTPKGENLHALAGELNTTTDWLLGRSAASEQVRSEVGVGEKLMPYRNEAEEPGIPLVGTGDCADLTVTETETGDQITVERCSFDPEYHIRYISRPPALRGARDLYAIYFHGSSMEPRFEAGEVGIVDPQRPPRPGDYVLVQLNNSESPDVVSVMVKRLVRQTAKELMLEQFNPPMIFSVPRSQVVRSHRIMPQTDLLFG